MLGNKNLYNSILGVSIEIKNYLKSFTPKDSGDLVNSYETNVDENGFILKGNSYFKFVDKGINGVENNRGSIFSYTTKRPPINQLQGFADRKGINVWTLQNSIFKKGTKANNILDNTLNKTKNIEERIIEGYIKDIIEEIKKENNDK